MSLLSIIIAPDPRLKIMATPVARVDDEVRQLMDDMLETMYAADGIGLAAPQVGDTRRIIVVDVRRDVLGDEAGDSNLAPICMANPELIWISEDGELHEEGCLSLPQHFSEVHRPTAIRVLYLDKNNELQKIEAGGILATCVQHEVDHLNGVLFVDHVSSLKRNMILRKLQKSKKQAEAKIG